MAEYSNRMYVIGDRETGILFIRLDPLRVSILTHDEILNYEGNYNKTFSQIGRQIQSFILHFDDATQPEVDPAVDNAFEALIKRGTSVVDADFCFISDMIDEAWMTSRIPWPLAHDSLANLQNHRPTGVGNTYEAQAHPPAAPVGAPAPVAPPLSAPDAAKPAT